LTELLDLSLIFGQISQVRAFFVLMALLLLFRLLARRWGLHLDNLFDRLCCGTFGFNSLRNLVRKADVVVGPTHHLEGLSVFKSYNMHWD